MKVVSDITRKMRTSMNTLNGMVTIVRERLSRGTDAAETVKNIETCVEMIAEETTRMIGLLNDLDELDKTGSNDVEASRLVSGRFADRHFLVVDDVPGNAMVIAEMISICGGIVVTASNGKSAVNAFNRSEVGDFDCILMDLRMPEMDGFAAAEAIRAMDRADAKKVPIIALSADVFENDREHATKAGMNACLTKPVRIRELSELLEKHLVTRG